MRANGDTSSAAWVLQRYASRRRPPRRVRSSPRARPRRRPRRVGARRHRRAVRRGAVPRREHRRHASARHQSVRASVARRGTRGDEGGGGEREAEAVATLEELCASVPLPTSSDGSTPTTRRRRRRDANPFRDTRGGFGSVSRGDARRSDSSDGGCFELFGLDFTRRKRRRRLLEVNSDRASRCSGRDSRIRARTIVLDVALPGGARAVFEKATSTRRRRRRARRFELSRASIRGGTSTAPSEDENSPPSCPSRAPSHAATRGDESQQETAATAGRVRARRLRRRRRRDALERGVARRIRH